MRLKLLERSFKHFVHHGVQRAPGDCIGNDFAVVQIHDGRQIELLASHFELGDVRGPFFIKVLGLEITLENVGRSLAYFALIFLRSTFQLICFQRGEKFGVRKHYIIPQHHNSKVSVFGILSLLWHSL